MTWRLFKLLQFVYSHEVLGLFNACGTFFPPASSHLLVAVIFCSRFFREFLFLNSHWWPVTKLFFNCFLL